MRQAEEGLAEMRGCVDTIITIPNSKLKEVEEKIKEMQRYRKELANTLEEWDEVGRAPGHICGLIEATEMETSPSNSSKIPPKNKRRSGI